MRTHSIEAAERMAIEIIRKYLPDRSYRVFLFGSRASGRAGARSDIDVGIEGPEPVPHGTLAAIQEALDEAPTLFTIEVVDFARVADKFRRVARERVPLEL
jgi:predicted nucleotidyltransferase